MKYSNIHTHTVFSDGKQTPRENIEAALALGMESIGFSDHSYTPFDESYCMKKENEGAYIAEIRALADEYRGRITVALGLEHDGGTDDIRRDAYDYLLGDCHYVKTAGGHFSVDHCKEGHIALCNDWFAGDYTAFARAYFETYAHFIKQNRPDVLGHFDLVSKFCLTDENDPRYRTYAREALEASLAVTPLIELNTGAIARGHRAIPYPAPYLWETVREHHGIFVLGSDSHETKNLTFYFDEACEMLRAYGFRSVAAFKNGAFEEVAL